MADSKLVVVHGMGVHSAEATKVLVTDAANKALNRYPEYQSVKFEDYVDVIGIGYDDIFEAERKRLESANMGVSQYLKSHGGISSSFVTKIVELEESIGEDNFYTTHALDVILYLTLQGEPVRLKVVKELSDVMDDDGTFDIHVLAHSLGTAVVHDTLHKAYEGGIQFEGKNYTLDRINNKLDSLWMIANVSNLTASLTPFSIEFDPFKTRVKPSRSDNGCTRYFYNVHHKLDPFTLFYRFDPKMSDGWVGPETYDRYYRKIETEAISESLNPHDLFAYLIDPEVCYPFLKRVMPEGLFDPSPDDIQSANAGFRNLVGVVNDIRDHVGQIDSIKDIKDLLEMVKNFEAYIEELQDRGQG